MVVSTAIAPRIDAHPEASGRPRVAIVHDYLTQMGGAERVVLAMLKAFPGAPLYTSVYDPSRTFPQIQRADVHTIDWLDSIGPLHRRHWLGFPAYGPAFRRLDVDADVVLCSSSGWAHHINTTGRKVVYCHTPNRWLHCSEALFPPPTASRRSVVKLLRPLVSSLARRDVVAARTADLYLANSTLVRDRIAQFYGLAATVLPPPPGLFGTGVSVPVDLSPGFVLTVSRLLSYKNVDAIAAAAVASRRRLVVVGEGPDRRRLERQARGGAVFLGNVSDGQLLWLYQNASCLATASYEDFGLVPLEANAFGLPVLALRWGGFLDTIVEGETGLFFDEPTPRAIASGLKEIERRRWDAGRIQAHARRFSEETFISRLRAIVDSVGCPDQPLGAAEGGIRGMALR